MIVSVVMPGVLIFFLYSLFGNYLYFQDESNDCYNIAIANMPESMGVVKDSASFVIRGIDEKNVENEKTTLIDCEDNLIIVFPSDFDTSLQKIISGDAKITINVEIYYNSSSSKSVEAYNVFAAILNEFEKSFVNLIDINGDSQICYDVSTEKSNSSQIFSTIIPMFLLAFIINGCVSISSESIAGEKERGTMAKLLVTPVKRQNIVIGKIIGLTIIGLISGISVFCGLILSLPSIAKGISKEIQLSVAIYTIKDYVYLLLIIIFTVFLFVSIVSVISGVAKSTKEANMMSTPLTIVSMIVSLPTLAEGSVQKDLIWYFIPIFNSVQCMKDVLSFSVNLVNMMVMVFSNLVFAILFIFILTKIIKKESLLFS